MVSIDFSEFSKSNFYQPNKFSSKDIKTIGIVAIGRDFKADVDIASIEFYWSETDLHIVFFAVELLFKLTLKKQL